MKNESTVSDENTLLLASYGGKIMRNNSGVLVNDVGTPVRFGLGNVSAKVNKVFKSSDQIGILPVVITPAMVGKTVGVFIAVEDKREGLHYTGKGTEPGQLKFIEWVRRLGGIACFASQTKDVEDTITSYTIRMRS